MRELARILGVGVIVVALGTGVLAYACGHSIVGTPGVWDGLGRPLTPVPFAARLVFGEHGMWAGWGWFAVDFVVVWGCVGLGVLLYRWGEGGD